MPTSPVVSTSAFYLWVPLCDSGPSHLFSHCRVSKRQGCVSHSTPEAEQIAAYFSLRHCGLPCLSLWWTLLLNQHNLRFHEDSQAMIRVVETGRNPTMRDLLRTHGVSGAWLRETFNNTCSYLDYELSSRMCADI
eukprot:10638928-Heterocapsa_arctica.AAC.1